MKKPMKLELKGGALAIKRIPMKQFRVSADPEAVEAVEDLEAKVERTLTEAEASFHERRKAEEQRMEAATDTEYWVAVCFQTREQRDAFVAGLGLPDTEEKYADGVALAAKVGITLPPGPTWQTRTKSAAKFAALAGKG
jgi:hypothetical protein